MDTQEIKGRELIQLQAVIATLLIMILVLLTLLFVHIPEKKILVPEHHHLEYIPIEPVDDEPEEETVKDKQQLEKETSVRRSNIAVNRNNRQIVKENDEVSRFIKEAEALANDVQQQLIQTDNRHEQQQSSQDAVPLATEVGEGEGKTPQRIHTTITSFFSNPERYIVYQFTPTYLGEKGGRVYLELVINRDGDVIDVKVLSYENKKLVGIAQKAAKRFRFSAHATAPPRQKGKMEFLFVRQ